MQRTMEWKMIGITLRGIKRAGLTGEQTSAADICVIIKRKSGPGQVTYCVMQINDGQWTQQNGYREMGKAVEAGKEVGGVKKLSSLQA